MTVPGKQEANLRLSQRQKFFWEGEHDCITVIVTVNMEEVPEPWTLQLLGS